MVISMKLLIRNLPRTTSEEELQALFEAYGSIQSCTIVLDKETGISKGFGFVNMPKPGEAKAAMKMLNGHDLAGNKIRVKKSDDAKPGTPTV
jgi:RNA recognition motif-containing protein